MLLATYVLWERFPRDYTTLQKLAFAGALLTLFLTFLLTSFRIDNIWSTLAVLKVDSRLKALAESKDVTGEVVYNLTDEAIDRLTKLRDSKQGSLSESEGIEFLTKLMKKELEDVPGELEVVAVCRDLDEFNEDAPAVMLNYEKALFAIAERGHVEMTYLLSQKQWEKMKALEPWLLSEGAREPWSVPEKLNDHGLGAIARHQERRLKCFALSREDVPAEKRSTYYLIVMSRRAGDSEVRRTLFGANIQPQQGIHILLGETEETGRWQKMIASLSKHLDVVDIPKWQQPPGQRRMPLD